MTDAELLAWLRARVNACLDAADDKNFPWVVQRGFEVRAAAYRNVIQHLKETAGKKRGKP